MNKIIAILTILFTAGSLQAQAGFSSGGHDSLLFDGAENYVPKYCSKPECFIIAAYLRGTIIGTEMRDTIVESGCELWDTAWICERKILTDAASILKPGDTLFTGSEFGTGTELHIALEYKIPLLEGEHFLHDRIMIGADTKIVPECAPISAEGRNKYKMTLIDGLLLYDHTLTRSEGNRPDYSQMQFETPRTNISHIQTKFSLEARGDADVIKVYEGSVEVNLKKYNDNEVKKNSEELKKLTEDYQNGKISAEEMIKKSKELSDKMKYSVNDFKTKITIEAGNQITVSGKLGEVVPIGADDDKWWSDENFK